MKEVDNSDEYRLYIYEGDIKLVFRRGGSIRLEPELARQLSEDLIKWARAAGVVRTGAAVLTKDPDARVPTIAKEQFYRRPKKNWDYWDYMRQEEAQIRKEVEKMEHCSNCGELFMDSFSCSISHGMIKHQKELVRKWDRRDKNVEKVLLDNPDFEAWEGEPVNIGFVDPMEGL